MSFFGIIYIFILTKIIIKIKQGAKILNKDGVLMTHHIMNRKVEEERYPLLPARRGWDASFRE